MGTWKPGPSQRPRTGKASKYKNRRMKTVHGWFDSKGELQRWLFLLDAERRGVVVNLKRQVEFPLEVNGKLVCTYVADFVYDIAAPYRPWVVEDFKGVITDVFSLKARLFRAVMGFSIRVVKSPTEDPCKVVDPVKQ